MTDKYDRREKIKDSLLGQLVAKGADICLFEDLINDYMEMWDLKEQLIRDVRVNGLTKTYETATGNGAEKDNPSVKLVPAINKQMLALLKQMGISTDTVVKEGASNDDL